jgi:dTDP-4-dehydrorhamnose reductase
MRALITGANGTIGKELRRFLEFQGTEVYIWDREKVPIFEYHIMEEFIQKINPDIIYHLAIASTLTGVGNETWRANYEWPSELAWICRIYQIKFVFTSTYEIFSDYNIGPFAVDTKPDAFEGFGFEKRMAEERVFYQNPQSIVIRLPWQITNEPHKKGMISYLDNDGRI